MIFEVAHQMALLPLLFLGFVLAKGGVPDRDHVLLASAFFMSWIGDSIASANEGALTYSYFWAPIQIVLAYMAIVEKWHFRRTVTVWAICTFTLLISQLNIDPGVLLKPIGGIGLVFLGRRSPLKVSILIYFGTGTIGYMLFLDSMSGPNVMDFWLFYQTCRALGILSLCYLILHLHKESSDVVVYN